MPTRSGRGFTLIELLVSVTISAVLVVGIIGVVSAQQRSYGQGSRMRAAQASARAAVLAVEQAAATAGYGLDGSLALDLDRYTTGPCPGQLAPCARDAVANSDELVFYRKDSHYWVPEANGDEPRGRAWRIQARDIAANTVTVLMRPGDTLLKGQILQAVCESATAYAYMTVATTTSVAPAPTGTETVKAIPLLGAVSTDPFRRQDAMTDACFTGGNARLFAIDRYRFHVRPVTQADGSLDPYLVLDMGVDGDLSGTIDQDDEVLIAEGVELMQVGYVMRNASLGTLGTTKGTPVAFTPGALGATSGTGMTTLLFPGAVSGGQSVYTASSWYKYAASNSARQTNHQANVVALRVGFLVRSATPLPGEQGGDPPQPFYNLNALPTWLDQAGRYARVQVETTVPLRNLSTRGIADF